MKLVPQLILVLLILAATAAGIVWLVRSSPDRGIEIVLPDPTAAPVVVLKAYISETVHNPGVYDMTEGDRLAELVEAAGAATDDADRSAINLFARIEDEGHWHISRLDETAACGYRSDGLHTYGRQHRRRSPARRVAPYRRDNSPEDH